MCRREYVPDPKQITISKDSLEVANITPTIHKIQIMKLLSLSRSIKFTEEMTRDTIQQEKVDKSTKRKIGLCVYTTSQYTNAQKLYHNRYDIKSLYIIE